MSFPKRTTFSREWIEPRRGSLAGSYRKALREAALRAGGDGNPAKAVELWTQLVRHALKHEMLDGATTLDAMRGVAGVGRRDDHSQHRSNAECLGVHASHGARVSEYMAGRGRPVVGFIGR